MLGRIILVLMGSIIAIPFAIMLFIRNILSGFQLFKIKERPNPPKIMQDKAYGVHKYVTINGVKIHYVESGDTSKPLVLFVHGFPEFWFSWRHQIKHFNQNYHVVALDMRGYNASSKPAGINNYHIDTLIEDIRCLIHAVGKERVHLVAHDWGGVVSWRFAAKHPQMLQSYTACNIPHPIAFREMMDTTWEQRLKSWYVIFFQCPLIPELFAMHNDNRFFDGTFKDGSLYKEPELIESFKYAFPDFTTWNRTINYYRSLMQVASFEKQPKEIFDIKVPVLQIFGTGDKYISVGAAKLSSKYAKDHRIELLDGVSHWVQQEAPDMVNKHLAKFIQQHS